MRLARKIFLACSLAILVLVAVGMLSLGAIGRLVSVNSEITMRTVPAIHLTAAVHDAVTALRRLEARFLLLRDPRFASLWDEQAARARFNLDSLRTLVTSKEQADHLREATDSFEEYRRLVVEEHALIRSGDRQRARLILEGESRQSADRVEASLDGLARATRAAALAAQAEAARLETRTWTGVVVALGAALALALAGTAVIANRLTRSLRVLSEATSAVAAGSFREPVTVKGEDEVAELSRAFNAMAARLRQVDELKESFLATVSHELRSPLTSMREAAHLLGDGVPGPLNEKQARLVTIVGESTERLLRLVNRILDLSRLRAGMLTIERHAVDLEPIVGRAVDELRPQADEAGIILERERVGGDFTLMGDEDRLVQVVVNLVANAIRFTPKGGRVITRLIDTGEELELQVEDTGVGIPAAALPYVFDWYQQAHQRRGGSGLGLAIVRGIVRAHGGRVTAESHEGKGSRFTVLLPRRKDADR